jgi:hypothetical protein
MVTNEPQYVTKMALSVSMGGLWGDFTAIFWIIEYLQRPIYIWNKISKPIMSQCDMNFQSIPLHITCIVINILNQFNMLMVYRFSSLYQSFKKSQNSNGTLPFDC